MENNGNSKTPLSAAQSKKTNGHTAAASTAKTGGTQARAARTSKKTTQRVRSSVLERIDDGILAFDSGLNYTYLNERAGELLDCEAADLIGRSVWEAHPEARGAPFAEACRRALETQTILPLEGYFPAADRWLEGRVYPSADGVSILFNEGPEQPPADNRREERYRILFDTMQEGFLLAEVIQSAHHGEADFRFLEVNASMARFLGREREELVGYNARQVLSLDGQELDTLQRACRVAAGEEEAFFVEKHDETSGRWLRGHIFSPKHGQFASLVTDVTEQREAEARIRDISRFPGENPNPVLRFTREGDILYANAASGSLLEAWNARADHTTPLGEIQGLLPAILEEGENTEVDLLNHGMFFTGQLVPVREQGYINLYLRDITERRQVEENLRAHIHQANAGITRADLEGRFIFVNQAFCDMLGYSEAELIGKTIWEISHEADVQRNKRLFERMVREGESFQLEKRLVRRNGSVLWINVGTSPLQDAGGRIRGATSIVVDITRRKRAEEALLDSARRSLYLSAMSDAIRPLSDPARIQSEAMRLLGDHLKASRAAYLEVEPDGSAFVRSSFSDGVPEISGQFELSACIPGDQMSRFRAGRMVFASDIPDDARFSGTQKACQEEMSSRAQILVPFLREGKVTAALCVQQSQPRNWKSEELGVVEETAERMETAIERARVEHKLRESEERLRLAGHAAGMCTWELNLQDQTYKLGDNFADVLGFPADLLPENNAEVSKLVNDEDLLAIQETIRLAEHNRAELPPMQFRVADPLTEAVLWLELNARLVHDDQGSPQRMFGMLQNITERKTIEELLRAKEAELEEIIHHTPFLLIRCTRDLRYRFVSRAYAEMIQRIPEEVTGRSLIEVMGEAGFNTIRPYVERVLNGERVEFESRVPFTGVSARWLHIVYTPDYDEHGTIAGWFASIMDITDRKQSEEALREYARQQSALYRLADELHRTESLEDLFDPALDAILSALQCDRASILLYDEEQVMRFVTWRGLSDAYRQATDGHSPWKPDVRNPQPISMDDVDSAGLEEPLRTVIRDEGIGALAFIPLLSNGKLIGKFMVYFDAPHSFTEAELELGLTISRQLAASIVRKRAEASLRESEQRYRTLFDQVPVGIYTCNADGLIQEYNSRAAEMWGRKPKKNDPQEKYCGSLRMHFPDGTPMPHDRCPMGRVLGGETLQPDEYEVVVERPDGTRRNVIAQPLVLRNEYGEISGAINCFYDITERRHSEEALRLSEERFTRFMQHLPGLAWIKDGQGRYVYANAAAEKAFGTSREQLYGRSDEEIFPDEVAARFRENDRQAWKDKKGVQVIETLQHGDGVLHYSLVNKFPIPGPDGNPALIGGTAFDITDRIQMEEALKGSRAKAEETAYRIARLQKITAALTEALTPSQVAEIVVEQGAPALGAATSSVMLLSPDAQNLEISYTTSPETVARGFRRFPITTSVPAAEAVRSGKPVWIESREKYMQQYPHLAEQIHNWGHQSAMALPMKYKDRTLGVLTFSFDHILPYSAENEEFALTLARQGAQALERARAEEALRDSEERHRAILSQATAGIVRKDVEGRLLFVNQAFCNMLDQVETDLLGRTMWELTHKEDVHENRRLFDRLMQEGIPFQLDKRLIRRDGSILWVNVSVSPVMDSSGKPHSAVSVYVDVTRHKQAEGRLTLLTRVSELSRQVEDPDDLLFAVAREVGEHFNVRRSLFNEVDLDRDQVVVHRDFTRDVDSLTGIHKVSEYSNGTAVAMLAGKTVVNNDSKLDPRTAQNFEGFYRERGERAYIAVPLMQDDTWVATLRISDDKPREWDPEDIQLLEAIAERTWTAAEKLRINRALRDSEERLRVTFNTTAAGFAMLNPDTRFVEVNDAFCQIVGYAREELLGIGIDHLTHPTYLKSTRHHIGRLLAGKVPFFTVEKLYIRGNDEEIWVQLNMSLVRDVDGSPQHLILICQDVTERRRVEEELRQLNLELEERVLSRTAELQSAYEFLRESEATSRLILESMPDAIVIADRQGKIVHANTQVESLFGYSPKEVLGQQVEMLLPERYREKHIEHRDTYTDQRSRRIMGLGLDLYGRRKDSSEFPVDVMLSPIDNNTAWDVMVSIRDNTKQREAQEALRTNEEKLRTLFEILPAGVSFLDRDGRINEMNSALTQILGLSKKELLQGSYATRQYVRADGTPMPQSEFASHRAVVEQRTINNVETGIVKENGQVVWTSVNAAPVQVVDVEVAVVTIDISERKRSEEALHRHRERLKVLSRRLVEVQEEERRAIARELHDRVGQNLAALTLNLNILRSQLSGEVLEKIGTRLTDSVNLVNDILAITRNVMADLRPNVLDDYGLDAAINEYADRFSQRYEVRVSLQSPAVPVPRLDTSIEMTLLRIAQEALTNIARHAKASQASVALEVKNEAVQMTVEDNGIGILSWQKVNQPGSHGLRIMRERAEAFGGSLKVHSSYNKGTRIEVMIPLGSGTRKKSQERRS